MAAKPTNTYAWNTGGANRTEPLAGKKVLGWIRGEKPSSSFWNWLFNGLHQWINYLSDGALEGDHSIDGDLDITGDLTVDGVISHGDRTIAVPAAAFQIVAVAGSIALGSIPETDGQHWFFVSDATGTIVAPVPLPVGTRIKTITWHFNKSTQAAALTMRLRKRLSGAAAVNISTTADVSNGAAEISVTTAAINYEIESNGRVWLEVGAGHGSHQFAFAEITYDVPPP